MHGGKKRFEVPLVVQAVLVDRMAVSRDFALSAPVSKRSFRYANVGRSLFDQQITLQISRHRGHRITIVNKPCKTLQSGILASSDLDSRRSKLEHADPQSTLRRNSAKEVAVHAWSAVSASSTAFHNLMVAATRTACETQITSVSPPMLVKPGTH